MKTKILSCLKNGWTRFKNKFFYALGRFLGALISLFQPKTNPKTRRRASTILGASCAMLTIIFFTLVALCLPLHPKESKMENRMLAEFPSFSFSSFVSGEYFSGINLWFSDTFPLRENMVKLSSSVKNLYGFSSITITGNPDTIVSDDIPDAPADLTPSSSAEPEDITTESSSEETASSSVEEPATVPELGADAKVETSGVILTIDDAGYEYYNFITETANKYVSVVNDAAAQLKGKATVYDMVVPNSMDVCVPQSVRDQVNTSDQRKAIEYFYSSMDPSIKTVSVIDTLIRANANGEYCYFRTDHHWTANGAYHAYEELMKAMNKPAADLNDKFKEWKFTGFLGSFYRTTTSTEMENNPDYVVAYEPVDTNDVYIYWQDGTESDYHIITDVSTWASTSYYSSGFIGGDEPFEVIENPNIHDGSSIMIVKESYGNCFVPFLVESFEHVYVADYRYYMDTMPGTIVDVVDKYDIQNVLFLNNISMTRSDSLVTLMSQFVG